MSNESQPIVSPQAYINTTFQETCQEINIQPQEVVLLLVFNFLQTQPEDRGVNIAELKREFNKFADAADFKGLQETIDQAVNAVELELYDYLAAKWEVSSPGDD